MSNGWSLERRAKQAEAIRHWQPWTQSTGPRTRKGKARAARNADKGGVRQEMRELIRGMKQAMRQQTAFLEEIETGKIDGHF